MGSIIFHGYSDPTYCILPVNTLFCSLSNLYSTTTIEFLERDTDTSIIVDNHFLSDSERQRVIDYVLLLAKHYGLPHRFHLKSKNSFPSSCGLGSSGSSFASIARAVGAIVNESSLKNLSELARLGSISAACSIVGGISILHAGTDQLWASQVIVPNCVTIAAMCIVIESKRGPTAELHGEARDSKFYDVGVQISQSACSEMYNALVAKDYNQIAEIAERQLNYNIALLSTGPEHLLIWHPETVAIAHIIRDFRAKTNIPVFCAMNSGPSL